MTRPSTHRPLVLGFHPTSHGFGWAVFENPLSLHSFGTFNAGKDKNASCLRKLAWLLERLEPETFVVEALSAKPPAHSERVKRLVLAAVSLAAEHNAEVAAVTKSQLLDCFGAIGAKTREEIAEAVARQHPALRPHLPARRKLWQSADRRMAVFVASAAVLARFHNEAAALLIDMRNAA